MSNTLSEKLHIYSQNDIYPFHMPGHKRMPGINDSSGAGADDNDAGFNNDSVYINSCKIDITEIDGFDDLHDASDIIKAEQEKAAAVYGSKFCYYLVNGSTCGNLAAISASVKRGGRILASDNCHRSVFHAIELMQLEPVYIYPVNTRCGIPGQISVSDIKEKIREYPDISAAVITSPTYDGVISDIAAIADVLHEKDITLIVDEAHGAHLGFHPAFPENAVRLGADAVIMSLHKTLPSLTQTSLLHICNDRIDNEAIVHYLDIYETSSPSYVLMDSISRCVDMLSKPSIYELFDSYSEKLKRFRSQTSGLLRLRVIGADAFSKDEAYAFDDGKILIDAGNLVSGAELKDILLNKYHLQMEKVCPTYVIAMTSIMDTQEGFNRLKDALIEIDKGL